MFLLFEIYFIRNFKDIETCGGPVVGLREEVRSVVRTRLTIVQARQKIYDHKHRAVSFEISDRVLVIKPVRRK